MSVGQSALVDQVFASLVKKGDGTFALPEAAQKKLIKSLRRGSDLKQTADDVVRLFHLAGVLHEEGSEEAAAAILHALSDVSKELAFRQKGEQQGQVAKDQALDRVPKRAPRLGQAKPKGALKAGDLSRKLKIPISS